LITPLVDSHCHLNQLDLAGFDGNLDNVMQEARSVGVEHCLCVCITSDDIPVLHQLTSRYSDVSMSIGVHPNEVANDPMTYETLHEQARGKACIAIGETGLDYYRTESEADCEIQRQRFREHIRVARELKKPLIIHTRQAAEDTLKIMQEERADEIGGVMHCFSENWDIAQRALALNFYISFSGIVTFKNAKVLHDVAQRVPLDKMLIETDSPYLAPVPHRGKSNHPGWVKYVAKAISELRNVSYETIANATTENFYRCFHVKRT